MAGYLFTLDSTDSLLACVKNGVYATRVGRPSRGYWSTAAEGTFADYATMQPGDNVYFFIKRQIYGVGELVCLGDSVSLLNYPGASEPRLWDYGQVHDTMLVDGDERSVNQRWLCVFRPSPSFFMRGVDMDDVLESNPAAFKMLRVLQQLSFIKFDAEENQAFRDAILKANQHAIGHPMVDENVFPDNHESAHARIHEEVTSEHVLTSGPIVEACASQDGTVRHEMAIEAGILSQLITGDVETVAALGRWDYLSHQVVASPFKPVHYMDKMDLFGYRYIPGHRPTVSRYLVGEVKSGKAGVDDIEQLLKYVDWVNGEYAHGDYSMIEAFLIARDFAPGLDAYVADHAQRMFTTQRRPARTETWRKVCLVRYAHVGGGRLAFERLVGVSESLVALPS